MSKLAAAAVLALTLAAAWSGRTATPLADLEGRSRGLVVSAPSVTDPALTKQNRWLEAARAGLRERDVVVIRLVGNTVDAEPDLKLDARSLRETLHLSAARFGVALVGKDGSVAFQRSSPITMTSLFGAIDAMPMRRQEMRARKP
jgi:hypothetical protein